MARISKEQKEKIRQSIVDVSKRLFIDEGYEATSTSKIAKEVGIAEGTLFNYFKTKTELFLEVITEEYFEMGDTKTLDFDIKDDVVAIYLDYIEKVTGRLIVLPKKVTLELFLALLNAYKKKPDKLRKYAELDFEFIDQITILTQKFQDRGVLAPCNPRSLSEMIYSILIYEYIMYLYQKDISKESLIEGIEDKLNILLKGYIVKG